MTRGKEVGIGLADESEIGPRGLRIGLIVVVSKKDPQRGVGTDDAG